MSATELDGWICPRCGLTNYYHPRRCSHCPEGRRTSAGSKLDRSPHVKREKNSRPADLSEIEGRKKIAFLGSTLLAFASWLYLIWEFHKWDAKWGSMHIGIPTLVAAAVIGGWLYRRDWYQDRTNPTGWKFMIIPLIGFAYRYDYDRSRASDVYLFSSLFDLGELAEGAGDMDESCLILLFIGLVILLIIGSAVVPHFWALSTFVLLVIMAMMAYREWRLVEVS